MYITASKDLQAKTNYFFYVVSYDTNGLEGSPSGEIDYVPPALSESIMTFATDGSTTVQFRAGTGALCHVEYTTALNPAQWQWLAVDTADTNGYGAVTDRTDRATSRFYRIAEP